MSPAHAEVIVLAAPSEGDQYYAEVKGDIFDFHVTFARAIKQHGDHPVILVGENAYNDYVNALGQGHVALAPMLDIWMRDFSTSNVTNPVMFRYSAAGQGGDQAAADEVQDIFARYLESVNLSFGETDLINDGGNFVDDYAGNVIVSNKFLRDNDLSENEAREILQSFEGIENVAFIEADEQGGLEHADGVVSFIDTNTLMINSYPEDPAYAEQLKKDLMRGLPGVEIHEIVTPYDNSAIHDERFGSACGLYTNALVTPNNIYLPQFNIPEDEIALSQVKSITSRNVVPVRSDQVCHMGGGVRCMSWQLRGYNADALLSN